MAEALAFSRGDIVCLQSNPSVRGPVVDILPGEPEVCYRVWHDNGAHEYFARQLIADNLPALTSAQTSLDRFRAHLTALQLLHPGISALYSFHAARITFIPYQFKPVLRFVRADRPRLLIADEVGVGKTIEAGLILRELQARRELRSVLILCPKPLVIDQKWERELKRFDETFVVLDGPRLRHCLRETDLDGEWPMQYSRCIVPYSLLDEQLLLGDGDHQKGLLDLDPAPRFDLIICDEAHTFRNTETQVYRAVQFLCSHAEAILFLTATPIQMGNHDLFVLLNLLRPDIVRDLATFEHMAEPNPFINRALDAARAVRPDWRHEALVALKDAGATPWGREVLVPNPDFVATTQLLKAASDGASRLAFVRQVEELHSFAHLVNRTRRRDIGKFTTRTPETISIPFSPAQQQLHDELLAVQARIMERFHGIRQVAFLMTTIRRQAASCLHGLAPYLREILTRRDLNTLQEDFGGDSSEVDDILAYAEPIEEHIRIVLNLAEQLDASDPKLDALLDRIVQKQQLPNNKILLFSAFRHTLHYLDKHIARAGVRCRVIHGGVLDGDRQELRRRFSLPPTDNEALDVLLSSEVGCEGLDYQFCDCLVNYDIPWNPMRVEQRIGRIDRYGQQSEKVVIYNFITPGTVEADIYERCLLRIGVFRQSIGGTEEILGEIAQRIQSVAEDMLLTISERQRRLQQISDNDIRVRQEQQALEDSQAEFFGITLPSEQIEEDLLQARSPWLTPAALENLVQVYLAEVAGKGDNLLGEHMLKTLRANQETRNQLQVDFARLDHRNSTVHPVWERWLKGGNPNLSLTFDANCASDNRSTTFITPVHPLAQQAARAILPRQAIFTAFQVWSATAQIPEGTYAFTIYQWRKYGIRPDVTFQVLCQAPLSSEHFMSLLENAQTLDPSTTAPASDQIKDALHQQHHSLWLRARMEHEDETRRQAAYRQASLRTSHETRLALLRTRLAQTTDERVRRIPLGEIAAVEADYARRTREIELAGASADIVTMLVAFGVMVVSGAPG